jgi:hypothetical protein
MDEMLRNIRELNWNLFKAPLYLGLQLAYSSIQDS